jgi:glycosyltransferase EpsJ
MSRSRRLSPALSIIVPMYNTRDYLPRCLDSIVNQTQQNIEVVIVDDASTDDSLDIAERYARDDPRFTVVRHLQNEGLHVARINGVLASSGQYLCYVDSDDCVAPDMFAEMYRSAVTLKADVVRVSAWLLREGDECPPPEDSAPNVLRFSDRSYDNGVDYLDRDFYPSMWLHMHHRGLWDLALPHFPRIRLVGEDNLTSFVLAFFARRVVSSSQLGYFYIERPNSLSEDRSFASVVRHIEHRGLIVQLLRRFIDSAGQRGEHCWQKLRSDNIDLLCAYIDGLESSVERLAAVSVFERTWRESLPELRRAAWGVA